jgi:hypothetical protein
MKNSAKKISAWGIVLIVLCCIVSLVALVLIGAIGYFKLSVASYYSASEKEFVIPDLKEDFVPQGMHYDTNNKHFLVTGYSSSGEASPIYIVGEDPYKTVRLRNADGSDFRGHAGGIAMANDYVYIAGGDDRCLYVYSYSEILSVSDGGSVNCKGTFSTKASDNDYVDVSCVTVVGDRIIIGEFYRDIDYPTLDSHKLTTGAGDYNQALAVEFKLSSEAQFGIEPKPVSAYSMPDHVQGMYFTDEKVYLSTSYGATFSHILEYDVSRLNKSEITVLGTKTTLYELDSSSLSYDYKIAPMSEEIEIVDGRLYVMCESASNKYIFGKLIGGKWCYSTDLEKMKNK